MNINGGGGGPTGSQIAQGTKLQPNKFKSNNRISPPANRDVQTYNFNFSGERWKSKLIWNSQKCLYKIYLRLNNSPTAFTKTF